MSAGAFVLTKYQIGSAGGIHPVRVQPETVLASFGGVLNAAPAGATTSSLRLNVSNGRRKKPGALRKVRVKLTGGTLPPGYLAGSSLTIVALTQAAFAAAVDGAAVAYLGATGVVVGRSPETLT
jgi:hypothetical protein